MLPALLWSVGFTLVVVIALAALGLALFVMHAIAYGGDSVFSPDPTIEPPSQDTYRVAFAVSALVAIGVSIILVLLARHTPVADWAPVLQGLVAALVAGGLAFVVMGCMLRVNLLALLT